MKCREPACPFPAVEDLEYCPKHGRLHFGQIRDLAGELQAQAVEAETKNWVSGLTTKIRANPKLKSKRWT